ncbi:unnamed protein product [Trifolium pratense]|uniref:Uncharacterized protein n=1 Tax=Trifolium pratense TaxID=57577 RepID=A0ACB0JVZ0_TRIPR|nr:unnamed protein product [Trifolium pratense]
MLLTQLYEEMSQLKLVTFCPHVLKLHLILATNLLELRTYLGPRPQQPPYAPLAHPAPDSNQHAHQHKPEKSAPRAPRANKYGYALQIDTCLWCRLGLKIRVKSFEWVVYIFM